MGEGEGEHMMSEAEFSHYIDSSFSLPPSLELRDMSNLIGCSGERHYSKRSQMPSQEHLLCRVSTKITAPMRDRLRLVSPRGREEEETQAGDLLLDQSYVSIPCWQAMDDGDEQTEPYFRGQQRKPFFVP